MVPVTECAIRANVPKYSQADAFSASDFQSGYLSLTENGLNRWITLSEGVTTVGPFALAGGFRVADSGKDAVEFIREKNHYYVKDCNPKGGVRLNGEELPYDKPTELKTMDAIQFSDTTLTFFLPEYQAQNKEA